MDTTPAISRFDEFYRTTTPPWVIGEPQPAIVELERAGLISGKVLDVGCGTGEHTMLLTRLGYDVLGIDFAPEAVEQARRNAAAKDVDARFEVADAMNLPGWPRYDTILDSALFHIFDDTDRPKYVASLHNAVPARRRRACARAVRRGSRLRARRSAARPFGTHSPTDGSWRSWSRRPIAASSPRCTPSQLGLPIGTRVDEPAWLARARRR